MVSSIRVKQPQSIVARCWNLGQDLSGIALLTFIVLKLVGVITWSWWWVLSPLWISGILVVLALCGLLGGLLVAAYWDYWKERRQMHMFMDQLLSPDQEQA
jgi:hypothetical protein